jgi:hypothetical protein
MVTGPQVRIKESIKSGGKKLIGMDRRDNERDAIVLLLILSLLSIPVCVRF